MMQGDDGHRETKKTIAVVGAGIIGVATALWLQRDGFSVSLIDRSGPGEGTSYGNGGVLASCSIVPVTVPSLLRKAPGMLLDPDSPLFLRWGYLPRLLPWLMRYLSHCRPEETRRIARALAPIIGDSFEQHRALAKGTRAEKWLVASDYLFIYKDRAAFSDDSFGFGIRRDNGFAWEEMEKGAFRAYDPIFGDGFDFAARFANHGLIADPGQYVKDLAAEIAVGGGRVIKADVHDIRREGGRATGVLTDQGAIDCDGVVIATGVWSGPLARKLGLRVPLESERGYHVELLEPNMMPRAPVMVAAGKFVATPMDGRLRLAGIVEFGGLDAPAGRKPLDLLVKRARQAMPSLRWKAVNEWMGHRPAPADSIPIIGAVPGAKNVWMGFGHHHVGLTGGPKTGHLLASLIGGKRPNIDLSAYDPGRFA